MTNSLRYKVLRHTQITAFIMALKKKMQEKQTNIKGYVRRKCAVNNVSLSAVLMIQTNERGEKRSEMTLCDKKQQLTNKQRNKQTIKQTGKPWNDPLSYAKLGINLKSNNQLFSVYSVLGKN